MLSNSIEPDHESFVYLRSKPAADRTVACADHEDSVVALHPNEWGDRFNQPVEITAHFILSLPPSQEGFETAREVITSSIGPVGLDAKRTQA